MERVTKKLVRETFPNGIGAFFSPDRPVFDIVDLDVKDHEGKTYLGGWAYPNKDFVFDVSAPEETDHGWKVKTVEGKKVFIYPLSKQRGDRMTALVKEYY